MKRLLAILLVAASATAWAQPEYAKGAESKKVDPLMISDGVYLGQHEGAACWVMQSENNVLGIVRRKDICVTLVDHNLQPLRAVELPQSSHFSLLAASMQEGKAALLLADQSQNRRTIVYTTVVDLDSMVLISDSTPLNPIADYTYGRKDKCMVWGATSPNGRLNALVTIIEYGETNQYQAKAALYDAAMNPMWEKEFAMGTMENLLVTDKGTLVTLGHEVDGEQSRFIYNIINQKKAETYEATVKCDPIRSLQLVNVVGNHAVALGTFTPSGVRHAEKFCGGVVGLSFNIDSAVLTGFTMRPFMNEDMNILLNKKTKKIQREQMLDLVSPVAYGATSFGGVIAVGRNYEAARVGSNGTSSSTFYRVGLHVVAVDTNGSVVWVRNFRRNDYQDKETNLLNVSIAEHKGNVLLLKNELPKPTNNYDISKEAKDLEVGDKSSLVMYSIDPTGEVTKTIIENSTKQTLLRTITLHDGSLMLMTASTKDRTRMATLRFQD